MEARIIFKNGTTLTAEQNGDSLIVPVEPTFPADLSQVTVETDNGSIVYVYVNASVQRCASIDGRYWFTFVEESDLERTLRELREENEVLTECILEMSEILYAE